MKLSEARIMLESGYSVNEIARKANIGAEEVREALGINTSYVKQLCEAGHSRSEIQELTGSDYTWVDRRLKELNERPADKRFKVNWELAPELYNKGWNDSDIARKLRCSPSAVRNWRDRNNLPSNWRKQNDLKTNWGANYE